MNILAIIALVSTIIAVFTLYIHNERNIRDKANKDREDERKVNEDKRRSVDYCLEYIKTFKDSTFIKDNLDELDSNILNYENLGKKEKVEFSRLLCYIDDLGYLYKEKLILKEDAVYLVGWYVSRFYSCIERIEDKERKESFKDEPDWEYGMKFLEEINKEFLKRELK